MLCDLVAVRRTRSRREFGFTLIELLVIVAIIAILSAILFPVFAQRGKNAAHHVNAMAMASMSYMEGKFSPTKARQNVQEHIMTLKSTQAIEQVFSIFDTNMDGVIDEDEYRQIPAMLRPDFDPAAGGFTNPASPIDVSDEMAVNPVYNQASTKHVFKMTLARGHAEALSAKLNGKKEDILQIYKQLGGLLRAGQISDAQYGVAYTGTLMFEILNQPPMTDGTNQ